MLSRRPENRVTAIYGPDNACRKSATIPPTVIDYDRVAGIKNDHTEREGKKTIRFTDFYPSFDDFFFCFFHKCPVVQSDRDPNNICRRTATIKIQYIFLLLQNLIYNYNEISFYVYIYKKKKFSSRKLLNCLSI